MIDMEEEKVLHCLKRIQYSYLVFKCDVKARVHDEDVVCLCQIDAHCTGSHGEKEDTRGWVVLL